MTDIVTAVKAASAKMGFRKPVLLYCHRQSAHARAIQRDIEQGTVPAMLWDKRWSGNSIYLVDEDRAAFLLRKHCDEAGRLLADRLVNDAAVYDFRDFGLLPDWIEMYGTRGDKECLCGITEYRQPRRQLVLG